MPDKGFRDINLFNGTIATIYKIYQKLLQLFFHVLILFSQGTGSEQEGPFSTRSLLCSLMVFCQMQFSVIISNHSKNHLQSHYSLRQFSCFFTCIFLVSENVGKTFDYSNEWFQSTYCWLLVSREHSVLKVTSWFNLCRFHR